MSAQPVINTTSLNEDAQLAMRLLADDKFVKYRKRFTMLTNSVTAAILLQRIIELWDHYDKKPFYRFKEAPATKQVLYRSGESWTEDLGFNRGEFDYALKIIGTRIKKGDHKREYLELDVPVQGDDEDIEQYAQRLQAAISRLVFYWTDGRRITYYEINEPLLYKFTRWIYDPKSRNLREVLSSVSSDSKSKKLALDIKSQKLALHRSDSIEESDLIEDNLKTEEVDKAAASETETQESSSVQATPTDQGDDPAQATPPDPLTPSSAGPLPPAVLDGLGMRGAATVARQERQAADFRTVKAHPLYQAFIAEWEESLAGTAEARRDAIIPHVRPETAARHLEALAQLDLMQAKPDHVRTIVAAKREAGKSEYPFIWLPPDVRNLIVAEADALADVAPAAAETPPIQAGPPKPHVLTDEERVQYAVVLGPPPELPGLKLPPKRIKAGV